MIARKLLVVVWHVLSERAADRNVEPEMLAYTLTPALACGASVTWSWKLSAQQRGGMATRQFVRYHLMPLNVGQDLTDVRHEQNRVRPLATGEEVLALHLELQSTD